MDDKRDEKIDRLLSSRRVAPASPDLARRIIFKAQQLPQNTTVPLWQWVRQLCTEFHLPKPAYVLAIALVFGLVIGLSTPPDMTSGADDDVASAQSVLSTDGTLL